MACIRTLLRDHDVYKKYGETPHIMFQYLQHVQELNAQHGSFTTAQKQILWAWIIC